MNENSLQFTVQPIKIENVVDVIPTIEYIVVPKVTKAEPQITDVEIVPEQFIPTSSLYLEDYIRPQELLVCRACLLSDCRLYSMRGHNLEEIYRCLANTPSSQNDNIPLLLCAKCACFLDKCQRFRQKTNIAQERLNSLIFPVTYKQIKETYDKVNKFSSLTIRQMPPDHYDYCVSEGFTDGTTLDIKTEIKSDDDDVERNDEKQSVGDDDDIDNDDERIDEKPSVENDDDSDYDEPLENVSISLKVQENEKNAKLKKRNPTNKSNVSKNKRKSRYKKRISHKRQMVNNVFKKIKFTLEQQLDELQKRKECVKYKFYKYKCDICFMAYNQEDRHKEHMSRHAEVFGNFVCEVCNLRFKTRQVLCHHSWTHRWRFCCVYCSFETNMRHSVMKHLYKHKDKLSQIEFADVPSKAEGYSDNTEPRKKKQVNECVICEVCGKYLQIGALKGHMEEHEGKTIKCEACDKLFNNSNKYQKHIKDYHSGINHDCPHCGKQYKAEKSKIRHIRLEHKPGVVGNFDCKLCSKVFKNNDYLKKHEAYMHYKTKTHKKRVYDPEKRRKKVVVREKPEPDPEKPFVCEHCYKNFKNKPYLQQHLNFVHFKKPRSRYWKTKSKTKDTTSKGTDVQKGRDL